MDQFRSQLFHWTRSDIVHSLLTTIFVAVIVALAGIVQQPGFDVLSVDWLSLGHTILNISIVVLVGDLSRRFVSDQNGKLAGKIG